MYERRVEQINKLLPRLSAERADRIESKENNGCLQVMWACHYETLGNLEPIFEALESWLKKSPQRYEPEYSRRKWATMKLDDRGDKQMKMGSLVKYADEDDPPKKYI